MLSNTMGAPSWARILGAKMAVVSRASVVRIIIVVVVVVVSGALLVEGESVK